MANPGEHGGTAPPEAACDLSAPAFPTETAPQDDRATEPAAPPPERRGGARSFVDMVRENVERPRNGARGRPATGGAETQQSEAQRRQDEAELMRLERMLRSLQERVTKLEVSQSERDPADEPPAADAPALAPPPEHAPAEVEHAATPDSAGEERPLAMRRPLPRREGGPRRLWPGGAAAAEGSRGASPSARRHGSTPDEVVRLAPATPAREAPAATAAATSLATLARPRGEPQDS